MTKFEQIGVSMQYNAYNKADANNKFNHSCTCCCNKGMQIDCDRCAISYTHSLVIACFDDKEKQKQQGK